MLAPACWFQNYSIKDGQFVIRKAGESFLMSLQHCFAPLGCGLLAQTLSESLGDDGASLDLSRAGNPMRFPQRLGWQH